MGRSDAQKRIDRLFPKPSISHQPGLAIIFGSTTSLFLDQILYWQGKGNSSGGWIYKTASELQQETGLTRDQQETAIKKCRELKFLSYRRSVGNIRQFLLDVDELEKTINSLRKTSKVDFGKPFVPNVGKLQSHSEINKDDKTTISKHTSRKSTRIPNIDDLHKTRRQINEDHYKD